MADSSIPGSICCSKCGKEYPATPEYFCFLGTWQKPRCRECVREYSRLYQQKNKGRWSAKQKQWRDEHPEEIRIIQRRRRARKHNLPDDFTIEDWQFALNYFENKCAYCGRTQDFWTRIVPDHWIAIADLREGNPGTVPNNIIPACHALKSLEGVTCCNQSKSNKDPVEWLIRRFGKRKAQAIEARIHLFFAAVRKTDKK